MTSHLTGNGWLVLLVSLCSACDEGSTVTSTNRDAKVLDTVVTPTDAAPSDGAVERDGVFDVPLTDTSTPDRIDPDIGGTDGATTDVPHDVLSDTIVELVMNPPTATLRVTAPMTPQVQAFMVRGRTRDGRLLPVTDVIWTVDRTDVLSISAAGVASTTNVTGGDVVVIARAGTLAASARVRVVLDLGVTASGAPPGVVMAFPPAATAGTDTSRLPGWVYPANETVFPQNVYKVLFQWRRGGNDRFRVTFESDRSRVMVYTDGSNAACTMAATGLGCFEPTLEIWRYIAGSNPRGTVRVTVDGTLASAPTTYFRSSTLNVGFSRGPVPGAIYYWSTTVQGVRRATVGDAAPTNFLTPAQADRECVACHTLSRRGNRLAADVGGNNLWVVEVSPTTPPPRIVTALAGRSIPMFWSTFSTDETRVVTAARGVMTLRNAANGSVINTVPLPTRTFGTQPDWPLDDARLVFTQSTSDRDRGIAGGRIATIDILPSNAWGTSRVLYGTGVNNDTNQFPSYSWDSRWIAWTHSTGNGQNDVTSDLWLMRNDGTTPRALTRANTVINNGTVTTATIQDNMPTWAPSGVSDDYAWVAFSSTRDYGGVLSGASRLGRHEQLWVAAVDLTAASASNADPSYPAFRLPFQSLDEDNHRPFWALDRVATTCSMPTATCATNADCCAPSVCRGGVCGTACRTDDSRCTTSSDCCSPSVCISGACRPTCRPPTGTCTTNADCCSPALCVGGSCATPACRTTGATCASDSECCAPNNCTGGMCRPSCTASGATCATSSDCCAPSTCTGGMCRPPCVATSGTCTSDTDCCSPGACRGGTCAAPCRSTGATCTVATDCCTGTCTRGLCAPPPCRNTGGSCTSDTDCCSGTCVGGGCAPG
jgi:hypothetical protein